MRRKNTHGINIYTKANVYTKYFKEMSKADHAELRGIAELIARHGSNDLMLEIYYQVD